MYVCYKHLCVDEVRSYVRLMSVSSYVDCEESGAAPHQLSFEYHSVFKMNQCFNWTSSLSALGP